MTGNSHHPMPLSNLPFPIHPGDLRPHWITAAQSKGFDIVARIVDRLHLALRCHDCGAITKVRLYTLMSAQPKCAGCMART